MFQIILAPTNRSLARHSYLRLVTFCGLVFSSLWLHGGLPQTEPPDVVLLHARWICLLLSNLGLWIVMLQHVNISSVYSVGAFFTAIPRSSIIWNSTVIQYSVSKQTVYGVQSALFITRCESFYLPSWFCIWLINKFYVRVWKQRTRSINEFTAW